MAEDQFPAAQPPHQCNPGAAASNARPTDDGLDGVRELTSEEEIVVAARARGLSHEAVGDLIGRSGRTARRRAKDSRVAEEIRRRRRDHADEAVGLLGASLPDAIAVVLDALGAEKESDRLRAADVLLGSFLRYRQRVDTDGDVAEIRDELMQLKRDREEPS